MILKLLGRRKDYEKEFIFISCDLIHEGFEFAALKVLLVHELQDSEKCMQFYLQEEDKNLFCGRLVKITGRSIFLKNIIINQEEIAHRESLLSGLLGKSGSIKKHPIFWSATDQDGYSIFRDSARESIDLESKMLLDIKSQTCLPGAKYEIMIYISYTKNGLKTHEIIHEFDLCNSDTLQDIVSSWPEQGSIYNGGLLHVIDSNFDSNMVAPGEYVSKGEMTIVQQVKYECQEIWHQTISHGDSEKSNRIGLSVNLNNCIPDIQVWEKNKYYNIGELTIEKIGNDRIVRRCKNSHKSGDSIDREKWLEICKVPQVLDGQSVYGSEIGKSLYKEIIFHLMLQVWTKWAPKSIEFDAPSSHFRGVQLGDKVLYQNNEYIIMYLNRRYKWQENNITVRAYRLPFEKIDTTLEPEFSSPQFITNDSHHMQISGREIKLSFPLKTNIVRYAYFKLQKAGD